MVAQTNGVAVVADFNGHGASALKPTLESSCGLTVEMVDDLAHLHGMLANGARVALVVLSVNQVDPDLHKIILGLKEGCTCPIVLFCPEPSPDCIRTAVTSGVHAFAGLDGKPGTVVSAVAAAEAQFEIICGLTRDLSAAKEALADRKIIERAKGLLMREDGIDEETAFRTLRSRAMDRGQKLVKVASEVLAVREAAQDCRPN